jgi:4-hydroxythreonine-4-phosphate dehydrogenase
MTAAGRCGGVTVLTCGDPAGVGPELAAAVWAARGADLPFAWIGDPRHLPAGTPVAAIEAPAEAPEAARRGLPVLALPFPEPARPGRPSAANAPAVVAVLDRAVDLVLGGQAGALCTAPVSKRVLAQGAGFPFPGHTDYLAHRAGGVPVAMMLVGGGLRTVPATVHLPLAEVPAALDPERLETVLRVTWNGLRRDFGIAAPRIAVAGLNPHAGEGGLLGDEETRVIAPVLARLAAEGMDLSGPHPADTLFHAAARARYDAAVCMYHDQALIPVKTLDFTGGVNVTLGLPFVRTSPDHGTAFDIAGTGRADPASLAAALALAAELAARRAGCP